MKNNKKNNAIYIYIIVMIIVIAIVIITIINISIICVTHNLSLEKGYEL